MDDATGDPTEEEIALYTHIAAYATKFNTTYSTQGAEGGIDGTFAKTPLMPFIIKLSRRIASLPKCVHYGVDFGSSFGPIMAILAWVAKLWMIGVENDAHRWELSQIWQGDLVKDSRRHRGHERFIEGGSEIAHMMHFEREYSDHIDYTKALIKSLGSEINNISTIFWFHGGWNTNKDVPGIIAQLNKFSNLRFFLTDLSWSKLKQYGFTLGNTH